MWTTKQALEKKKKKKRVMSMQCIHGYTVYEKRMYVCLYWLWSTDYVQMCEILWNKYSFIQSQSLLWQPIFSFFCKENSCVLIWMKQNHLHVSVPKIRKNIYRPYVEFTFQLYSHFRCLQLLYSHRPRLIGQSDGTTTAGRQCRQDGQLQGT